jgi:MIP family channel proteins
MERSMPQKLIAEFIGTFTLIFIGAGSILAFSAAPGLNGGIVSIALAHGLAIATMVSALGHVSGGHFNPAVTIGMWVTQKIEGVNAITYILAQLAGAAAGAGVLRAALQETTWKAMNLGTPGVTAVSNGQAVLIEAILTFFLVWVIFATAVDPEGAFGKIAGLAIGFVIVMDIMMGGAFTGAAMNPARSFGPALLSGTWTAAWVYWVGPIAGGIVAASVYDTFILRPRGTGGTAEHDAEMPAPHGWGAHGEDADSTVTNE